MSIAVTPGSGAIVSGDTIGGEDFQRVKLVDGTVGSTVAARVDPGGSQFHVPGQSGLATYAISGSNQANTAPSHALVVEAPASGVIRIARLIIWQPGIQTTAGVRVLQLVRTTSPGTGGVITPQSFDPADPAYGGVCRAKPTPGAEGVVLLDIPILVPTAVAAFVPLVISFAEVMALKRPVIPAGTANGIALRDPGAAGGASFSASLVFTVGS